VFEELPNHIVVRCTEIPTSEHLEARMFGEVMGAWVTNNRGCFGEYTDVRTVNHNAPFVVADVFQHIARLGYSTIDVCPWEF